jgi:hypothetical protein
VGSSGIREGEFFRRRAVIWEESRILRELPTLEGYLQMEAFDCSDDGSVIVGVAYALSTQASVIWTESTGTILLRDYFLSMGVDIPSNIRFSGEFDISADGLTFACIDGPAFIVTIPTPASTALLGMGCFAARRRR